MRARARVRMRMRVRGDRVVIIRRGDEARLHAVPVAVGPPRIQRSLQIRRIAVLERPPHADFDGDGAQVGGDAVQAQVGRAREGREAADDAREVVLVLGREALDLRHELRPDEEEGPERGRAVRERQVRRWEGRAAFRTAGERDRRRVCGRAQGGEVEAERGAWLCVSESVRTR